MKQTWEDHGTKILGIAVAAVGAFQIGVPQLQPHLAPLTYVLLNIATSVTVAVLGALTLKRGFSNSGSGSDGTDEQSGT